MNDASVNVLIVDDRPDKLLALEAVLEGLGENLVKAESGREALRHLLKHEFAVILLDINMPGMDGLETAQLIRQRRNSADVPIIFLTAMGDEMHKTRGYSLGAVDYILTPVVPQILLSKVSVFVDLFKKTQQVRLQADRLRQRATQLHQLTTASIAINSAPSVDKIVRLATDAARSIIESHQATTLMNPRHYPLKQTEVASYSAKYANWKGAGPHAGNAALLSLLNDAAKPIRMVQLELETQVPPSSGVSLNAPSLLGLLAAPLTGRDGRHLGVIYLSEKVEGDFTDDDQAVLIQLAQTASVAIENTIYAAEREDNRFKEEFLSTVSHELRTPLSAMAGWIQLLRREPVNDEIAHGLEVIERNVHAQTRLIEDLLDLSRISTGKLRLNKHPVHLRPVVEAAIEAMRAVILERQITLCHELDGVDPVIIGDADRLQQVFWNLLSNAAKFTPPGGTITVRLLSSGGRLKLQVEDTGQGIDPDFLPHVFNRFRQAEGGISRRHGGLGIGLTIVRHLVELHHGSVSAESPGKGRGATFTVTLTDVPSDAAASDRSQEQTGAEPPSLEGISVLLVDDHPDALEVVCEILSRQKAKVASAASARQAIDLLASVKADVLVTDLGMPDQDGFSLLREVRQLPFNGGGRMPAIAVTAHARAEDRLEALQAGFQAHLAKPVDPHELIEAVNRFGRCAAEASSAIHVE